MKSKQFKTCFISAPASVDTTPLRQALAKRGIGWQDAASIRPGTSVLDTIRTGIADADFVCAIIPALIKANNILFELGLAVGGKRPVLVLAEPGAELPFDVQGLAYARIGMGDLAALNFHLDAFLHHATEPQPAARPRSLEGGKVDLSGISHALKDCRTSIAFEALVARLFKESGALVTVTGGPDEQGVDMAVWIDGLQPAFGNPILVQVKFGNLSPSRLNNTITQLQTVLTKSHAQLGLVVHMSSKSSAPFGKRPVWPLVIALSADELVNLIREGRLSPWLLERRNKIVHQKD